MAVLQRQASLLRQLVEGLLDVASLDLGRTQPDLALLDLNELLLAALPGCADLIGDRNAQLATSFDDAPLYVKADQKMIRLVLTHLVNNAAERTPQGSTVWVSVRRAQEAGRTWATLAVRDAGQRLGAAISGPDSAASKENGTETVPVGGHPFGSGMGEAMASAAGLGGPGRTIAPGQGLRLAICQEIAQRHGGKIAEEQPASGTGAGTIFTLWLPSAQI